MCTAKMLTKEEQMDFATSTDEDLRESFASLPDILPEVVDYMLEKEDCVQIRRMLLIASNSNIWTSTLSKAARKETDEFILQSIALHLKTDVETLEYLAELNIHKVNWGLSCNPNTKKQRLDKLADINDNGINSALLKNPNTSKETCEKILSNDEFGRWDGFYYYTVSGIKVVASGN